MAEIIVLGAAAEVSDRSRNGYGYSLQGASLEFVQERQAPRR
jgi:hypothetical protein